MFRAPRDRRVTIAGADQKVSRLDNVAAIQPDVGETASQLLSKFPDLNKAVQPGGEGYLRLDPAKFAATYAADVPPAEARFMADSRTAEGLIEFLNAVISTDPTGPHPNAIEQFLTTHPAALRFVQIPKPIPTSFAKESFFAVSAFKFTNAEGVSRYGRYRVQPVGGSEYLSDTEAAARGPNFLFEEIKERVAKEPVRFWVAVQLAEDGDTVDDATIRWPEGRPQQTFGEISLREIAADNTREQQQIIFDPIPRVDGIEASADPLFEPRANAYLMSGRRRRAAGKR